MRALLAAALLAAPLSAQGILVDSDLDELYRVDLSNGNVTLIGSTANNGLGTPADLAWREDTNELYTIDLAGGEVGTLDLTTATFNPIWQTGISGWQGMAWDPAAQVFWLANQSGYNYVLDPATGTTTRVANSGYSLITCLDVDAGGTLWGIDFSTGFVVRIDKTTGVGSTVSTTIGGFQGLAFDVDGLAYGTNTNDDSLHRIDLASGNATLIGANPGIRFAKGFEIIGTAVQAGGTACPDGNRDARRMTVSGSSSLGSVLNLGVETGSVVAPAYLMFGFSADTFAGRPLPLELGFLGAPGCFLYIDPVTAIGPIRTGVAFPLNVPNVPAFAGGRFYVQGAVVDVSGSPNALGIVFTDFLRVVITR